MVEFESWNFCILIKGFINSCDDDGLNAENASGDSGILIVVIWSQDAQTHCTCRDDARHRIMEFSRKYT